MVGNGSGPTKSKHCVPQSRNSQDLRFIGMLGQEKRALRFAALIRTDIFDKAWRLQAVDRERLQLQCKVLCPN